MQLPREDNHVLIYQDLGVYEGQRLGTPCDDLLQTQRPTRATSESTYQHGHRTLCVWTSVAISELPVVIMAPAVNRTTTDHRAGVTLPSAQELGLGQRKRVYRYGAVAGVAVAELAVGIVAPALDCHTRIDEHGTRVVRAQRNRRGVC